MTPLAGLPRRRPEEHEEHGHDAGGDTLMKYLAMFQRRAEKGQCFTQPCFGCREFPAYFELADAAAMQVAPGINRDADLGLILYDVFDLTVTAEQAPGKVEKVAPQVSFFPARLAAGVVNVPTWAAIRARTGGAA